MVSSGSLDSEGGDASAGCPRTTEGRQAEPDKAQECGLWGLTYPTRPLASEHGCVVCCYMVNMATSPDGDLPECLSDAHALGPRNSTSGATLRTDHATRLSERDQKPQTAADPRSTRDTVPPGIPRIQRVEPCWWLVPNCGDPGVGAGRESQQQLQMGWGRPSAGRSTAGQENTQHQGAHTLAPRSWAAILTLFLLYGCIV